MTVMRKRNRLVSFRLSEQEYEALQNYTLTEGARSISDFARSTLCEVLDRNGTNGGNELRYKDNNTADRTLERLVATMGELNRVISRLSILVESNTGNGNGNGQ